MFELSIPMVKCNHKLLAIAKECGAKISQSANQYVFSFEEKTEMLDFTRTSEFVRL